MISFEKVSRDAIRAKREEKWSSLTQVCLFLWGYECVQMCTWNEKLPSSRILIRASIKRRKIIDQKYIFEEQTNPFPFLNRKNFLFSSASKASTPVGRIYSPSLDEYIRNIRKVLGRGEEPEDNRRGWATALSDIRWNRNDEPLHFRCAVSLAPIDDWPLDSPSNRSNTIVDR